MVVPPALPMCIKYKWAFFSTSRDKKVGAEEFPETRSSVLVLTLEAVVAAKHSVVTDNCGLTVVHEKIRIWFEFSRRRNSEMAIAVYNAARDFDNTIGIVARCQGCIYIVVLSSRCSFDTRKLLSRRSSEDYQVSVPKTLRMSATDARERKIFSINSGT